MLWVLMLFANGTVVMLLNATVAVPVLNVTLPAEPMWGPVVELDGVPVPALSDGRNVAVVTGGGGLVTIRYVPKLVTLNGLPAVNITTNDVVLIWANGSLLVAPSLRVLNLTRVDSSLVILAKGPGYVAYAVPHRPEPTPAQLATATAAAGTPRSTTTPAVASATAANSTAHPSPASNLTTQTPPVAGPPTTSTAVAATTQTSPPGSAPGQPPGWLLPLVAAAAAAGAAFVHRSTKRRQQADLGEVDAKILEYVRRRGGAYEAEIAKELDIPRTTVFRAVRRLEAQGLVRLVKREGRNWVAPAG
ncbi:MAG: MarR family transcriptional regulator [Pyrobaculum sp.]